MESSGEFVKNTDCWPPPARVSDSGGLGRGLRICTSNKFPDEADAADPETACGKTTILTNTRGEQKMRGELGEDKHLLGTN